MRTTALEVRTTQPTTARSTSGEVAGLSSQLGRVQIPHESLTNTNGLADGSALDLHSRLQGSTPCRSTDKNNNRAEVQMGARLLWEQEDLGSTPRCPT